MGKKTIMVAGFLNIESGAIFLAIALFYLLYLNPVLSKAAISGHTNILSSLSGFTVAMFLFLALLGILDGYFAFRSRKWGLAFSISILLSPMPLFSTGASVLLVQARHGWSKTRRILIGSILSLLGCFVLLVWIAVAFS